MGPCAPDAGTPAAGVGLVASGRRPMASLRARAAGFQDFVRAGRLGHFLVSVGAMPALHVSVFYGWTRAMQDEQACTLAAQMWSAAAEELQTYGGATTVLLGDLSVAPERVWSCQVLLDGGAMVDLGGAGFGWSTPERMGTCRALGATQWGVRDFIFISPDILPAVRAYHVQARSNFLVHRPLHVCIDAGLWVRRYSPPGVWLTLALSGLLNFGIRIGGRWLPPSWI